MSDTVLSNINATVGVEDTLVILVDVCMGKLDESLDYLSRITTGQTIIVPGNHDRWSLAYMHKGEADEKREQFRARYEASNEKLKCLPDREPSQWAGHEIVGANHPLSGVTFSHYPSAGDSHTDDRYENLRPITGTPVIHGHVHEAWREHGNHFNVGVDVKRFTPVSETTLIEWLDTLN